jgi:cobalt/nickel transport system permease protein
MHIPDGYLSPETCGVMGAAMVPVWTTAGRRVRKVVTSRYVPLLALGAAYSFLVMMFNVPIPDGTTAHAVGAVLIAILLGPWAAVVAVSCALAIQALFFGDGGVLAFGANCFNMAFVMPMFGYGVYQLATPHLSLTSPRRAVVAGLAGYAGLNVAAACAAIEIGIQPTLFHTANGTPLYSPFHLSQSIPAMALAHLTVAGTVELVLTAGVISYLQRANLPVLRINHRDVRDHVDDPASPRRLGWRWGAAALGGAALLTPIGLLASGTAFGEGSPKDLNLHKYHLQAVPNGLAHYAGFWHHAMFSGYDFSHDRHPALGYIVSAFVGMAVIALVVVAVLSLIGGVRRRQSHPRSSASSART